MGNDQIPGMRIQFGMIFLLPLRKDENMVWTDSQANGFQMKMRLREIPPPIGRIRSKTDTNSKIRATASLQVAKRSLPDADADWSRFGVERREIHRFNRNAGKHEFTRRNNPHWIHEIDCLSRFHRKAF